MRALKEGFGPFPVAPRVSPLRQRKVKTIKKSPTPERKVSENEKRESPLIGQEDTFGSVMDVEPLHSGTPGCSTNLEYMERSIDWPKEEEAASWKGKDQDKEDTATCNITKIVYSTNIPKANVSSKKYITDKPNVNVKNKSSSKGIRIIENRQLVPPRQIYSSPASSDWARVGRKGRGARVLFPVDRSPQPPRPLAQTKGGRAVGLGKRLIKPAVVTISNRSGDKTYAQILAKARENVNLKNLGIQTTVIRRAVNGAIVIEVPGPEGKQLAGRLKASLTEAFGEDAVVQNPVAMGELRLRGVDPSTTTEEVYAELESIGGCTRQDLKVSTISNMRDGMGVTWVSCPLQTAVYCRDRCRNLGLDPGQDRIAQEASYTVLQVLAFWAR